MSAGAPIPFDVSLEFHFEMREAREYGLQNRLVNLVHDRADALSHIVTAFGITMVFQQRRKVPDIASRASGRANDYPSKLLVHNPPRGSMRRS